MILRLIGLLILVIGTSCLLAYAPWQIVLLGFGFAGIGYGVIKLKQSATRRRKMRRLWTTAKEIDLFESFYSEQKELEDILDPDFTLPTKQDRDKIWFPHRRKKIQPKPQLAPIPRQSQGRVNNRTQSRPQYAAPQPQYAARTQSYSPPQAQARRKTFNMSALASRANE